jgi:hypothetical protein
MINTVSIPNYGINILENRILARHPRADPVTTMVYNGGPYLVPKTLAKQVGIITNAPPRVI